MKKYIFTFLIFISFKSFSTPCITTFATIYDTICGSSTFLFNGNNLSATGTYTATLVNAKGCDSIVTLYLTKNAKPKMQNCPSNITTAYTTGLCGANVTYTAPTAYGYCSGTSNTVNFSYTGGVQNFIVPAGVSSINVKAWGAGGGGGGNDGQSGGKGGGGAFASKVISVTPGTVYSVYVGGYGTHGSGCIAAGGQGFGGFGYGYGGNGGATGSIGCSGGGAGGGGGSAITLASTPLVVAGGGAGGGGGGNDITAGAGGAGGLNGISTTAAYGFAGSSGSINGAAGTDRNYSSDGGAGGGGGGGYNGGSGGGAPSCDCSGGGGGGGNSLGSTTTNGSGITPGNSVVLSSLCASCAYGASSSNVDGNNGYVSINYTSYNVPVTQIAGLSSGSLFPVGVTTNKFVAIDGNGNTDTCIFTVTITGTTTINTPPSNSTITYGSNATFTVAASGISPLTYQWKENGVNISNGGIYSGATTATLTLTKPGVAMSGKNYTCFVTNACSNSATSSAGLLTVNAAPLTITAANQSKAYGAGVPSLTFTYSGFVNGESATVTPASVSTSATSTSAVGTYAITVSGAADPNYNITYVAGTLTVNKVALTITATNQSKAYGAGLPSLTFTYSGLVNGDVATATLATINTTATSSSTVGTYAITVSGATDPNYNITYVAGTLSVNKVSLIITAHDTARGYLQPNPIFTYSYTGLVNGDVTIATPPTGSTIAISNSPTGTYPIILSGASDPNYTISYVPASLTIKSVIRNGIGYDLIVDAININNIDKIIDIYPGKASEDFNLPTGYTLNINDGSTFSNNNTIINDGTINLLGSATFINHSLYKGNGSFHGAFINASDGTVSPGQ